MNEGKLNRYSLEQAEDEAEKIKARVKFQKAGNYQKGEEMYEKERKDTFQKEL